MNKFITRKYIQQHPEIIFVFGDNLEERGFGGQAAECRGEPNAFGIPTKYYPKMDTEAFFSDKDCMLLCYVIDKAIRNIPNDGREIYVLPRIGAGLAQMPKRCPRIYKYLVKKLKELG